MAHYRLSPDRLPLAFLAFGLSAQATIPPNRAPSSKLCKQLQYLLHCIDMGFRSRDISYILVMASSLFFSNTHTHTSTTSLSLSIILSSFSAREYLNIILGTVAVVLIADRRLSASLECIQIDGDISQHNCDAMRENLSN